MSKQVIVITGASSGFGALTARALAKAGHTVYAGMRQTEGRNAPQVAEAAAFAKENGVDLKAVELDVASDASVEAGIAKVIEQEGRIDTIIHNAGHMSFGPAEAFTPEQFAELYDINVLSTQRVNRAALPHLRQQGKGLVVWVSSSSTRGGTPPYLALFRRQGRHGFARRLLCVRADPLGIETAIIVPGAFTKGTNHFAHSGSPADKARAAEYDDGPYAGVPDQALKGLASLEPADADAASVAVAIVDVVNMPFGTRPFRIHIDPSEDGAEIVNGVADRVRAELFRRIGLEDLLRPHVRG